MYIKYKLEDGRVIYPEVSPELAEFILKSDREIANADRRERYHAPYHIEALDYEGMEFADLETPEDILIRKEEHEWLEGFQRLLTGTQLRRLSMKAEGMNLHQIAAAEDTTVNAVLGSLKEVMKKAEKYKKNF